MTHDEAMRAWLDGQPMETFLNGWFQIHSAEALVKALSEECPIRLKAKSINVNGVEVPAPITRVEDIKDSETYYVVSFLERAYVLWTSGIDVKEHLAHVVERGILHSTPEACSIHARAMLKTNS